MRWAKSYSIIDHNLLHGGFLHRLSHEAMVLYLFLVVVGDREGKSFYNESRIMGILRLSATGYQKALKELIVECLIFYRCPYYWVKNIESCVSITGGVGYLPAVRPACAGRQVKQEESKNTLDPPSAGLDTSSKEDAKTKNTYRVKEIIQTVLNKIN